jgi:hypothetical protein
MSDLPLPDDELLSSHLDGELTAADEARLTARLADDPGLRTRLDELRRARELAATSVPALDVDTRDALLAAALAEAPTGDTPAPPVVDLGAERRRRRIGTDRLARVAAVVVLCVLAVPVILSITGGDDDLDTASVGSDDSADVDSAGDDGAGDVNELRSAELDESAEAAADGMAMDDVSGGDDADAAGTGEAADMDDAEMNDADMDAGDDGDATTDDEGMFGTGETAPVEALRLFVTAAGFDVLDDELGDFDDREELTARAALAWDEQRSAAPVTEDTDDGSEGNGGDTVERSTVEGFAAARFDELGVEPCEALVDLLLARYEGSAVTSADYATARIAGVPVIVGVIATTDATADLVIIEPTACTIEVEPLP